MSDRISATEARIHFGDLMRRVVEHRRPVVVERDGKPQVVILAVDDYQRLLANQPQPQHWEDLIAQAHEMLLRDTGGRDLPASEEIIRQMREERDAELLGLH